MLNEGLMAAKALKHFDLLPIPGHPDVKQVGKAECLLVILGSDGVPAELELLEKVETAKLWKHAKGNHNSFPAIRLKKPLLSAAVSKKLEEISWDNLDAAAKKGVLLTLDFSAVNPKCGDFHIAPWTQEQLRPVLECEQPELMNLRQLIRLFPKDEDQETFNRELLKQIASFIETETLDDMQLDFLKQLLVGKKQGKNGGRVSGCMTYFDVSYRDDFPSVLSPETGKALSNLLRQAGEQNPKEKNELGISPLTGERVQFIRDKYPDPNLPVIGPTYLYSKKHDIPCLERYGMTGLMAFSAGREEADRISGALQYLTREERRRKTWKRMGSACRNQPQLLIAYLEDDPANDMLLAEILSGSESKEDEIADGFEILCEQVMGPLEKVINKNPDSKVELILLEKLDTGRRQVSYEDRISAQQLVDALKDWLKALRNLPEIKIHIFPPKRKNWRARRPCSLRPYEICELLKFCYGKSAVKPKLQHSPVTLQEIYSIYIPKNKGSHTWTELVEKLQEYTLERGKNLLGDIGRYNIISSIEEKIGKKTKFDIEDVYRAYQFLLFLGILLYQKGIRKETYMEDTAYNIGQLLKLADILHREYCIQLRNGGDESKSLPNSFIGNEMLFITAENPAEGICRLMERMSIYMMWAKKEWVAKSGYAKWVLARIGDATEKIKRPLPKEFSTEEKAELFIGYMANIPKVKSKDDTNESEMKKEENHE